MIEALIKGTAIYTQDGAIPHSFPRPAHRLRGDHVSIGGRLFIRITHHRTPALLSAIHSIKADVVSVLRIGTTDVWLCLTD